VTNNRWARVEALYHAAAAVSPEERSAFLDHECGDDPELRRELESLLTQPTSGGLLTSDAPVIRLQPTHASSAHRPFIGKRIGSYEIVSLLGVGGMGEVYRAKDSRLGREVALKILPAAFATDPARLARFEREARLLASLNHPNIATIHGIEDAGGHPAIVMELVEGQTLAERLGTASGESTRGRASGSKRLSVGETVGIAKQIADALDAAHERGIIHRDLKPANIQITPNGLVKVLDFGIAKTLLPDDQAPPATTLERTETGAIIGTPAYMSPEQVRGGSVDKRADIWAFGCVLYEMLAGAAAFGASTVSDTIARILERDVDWSLLPAALPSPVRRVLARCLEKDPRRRVRDIADVRADLEDASGDTGGARGNGAVSQRLDRWFVFGGAAVVAGAAAIAGWTLRGAPPEPTAPTASIERMTFDAGFTTMPALSADGRLLAYASDRGGRNLDIWVQQTIGGTPLRLTDDAADDTSPDFSPDGRQIAFRSERAGGGVFVAPTLGGPARLIVPGGRGPRFSPDGSRIAYWTGTFRGNLGAGPSQLFVAPLAGGAPVPLLREFVVARDPVWSPDGRGLIAFARRDISSPPAQSIDWWWVPLNGVPVKTSVLELPDFRDADRGEAQPPDVASVPLAWTAAGVLFTDGQNLWSVPISTTTGKVTAPPRQVTFGTGLYRFASAARDGTLVFDARSSSRVVQRVSLDGAAENPAATEELVTDGQQGAWRASTTRDGSTIAIERAAHGRWEIWTKQLRTGQEQFIIAVTSVAQTSATISQDGSRIAYTTNDRIGGFGFGHGFVIETTGGVPKALCSDCTLHGFLSDNHHVLSIAKRRAVQLIDMNTGAVQDVVTTSHGQISRPHASADDHWLAFGAADSVAKSYVVPLTPGHPPPEDRWQRVDEPTTTGRPTGWALNAPILYLLLETDGFRCLWAQQVDPLSGHLVGRPTVARHFHREQVASSAGISTSLGNAVSAPGLIFETIAQRSDIWKLTRKH
jgi:serine/threonine protein kinase/Tol biopolymer transport system component